MRCGVDVCIRRRRRRDKLQGRRADEGASRSHRGIERVFRKEGLVRAKKEKESATLR